MGVKSIMRKPLILAGALTVGALSALAMYPDVISGHARVVDGDTIVIKGLHIRLFGIDAPEIGQMCGQFSQCGELAKYFLKRMVRDKAVRCVRRGMDAYHRIIATCSTYDYGDLGEEMVLNGQAVAYRYYSNRYTSQEDEARADNRGIWSTQFDMPWVWRQEHRSSQE